jgi:propionyl-CoA carboxylase beta chain
MRELILKARGRGDFYEIQAEFAKNILTGFIRLEGSTVGVGREPAPAPRGLPRHRRLAQGRALRALLRRLLHPDPDAGGRAGLPPGVQQELGGIIKHGAKLLFAYGEATVPKVTVITRKAYGGAYDVMASKHLRGDVNYAWPTAEIAVMGAKGAVEILYRADRGDAQALAQRTQDYEARFANPFVAAERGFIDEVIRPRSTRARVGRAFAMLRGKQLQNPWKKHDNIPL